MTNFVLQLSAKLLDLLTELVPGASRIVLLVNPGFPSAVERITQDVGDATRAAFASFAEEKTGALIVTADIVFLINRDQVVALASRHGIPAIYHSVLFPRVGGLISYGVDDVEVFGRAVGYVGRILNGADPAEMPVERPTRFKLTLNLKAAKALGLTMPTSILVRADKVIE